MADVKDGWVSAYEGWRRSGKTQREYCDEAGVPFTRFKYWVKKVRGAGLVQGKTETSDGCSRGGFSQVHIDEVDVCDGEAYCEIWFSGKKSVRIESRKNWGQLCDLVRGLIK